MSERTRILADFKSGRHLVMIATDVASRGLGALFTPLSSV
jgi:superfamily II DNA/RNA helicase